MIKSVIPLVLLSMVMPLWLACPGPQNAASPPGGSTQPSGQPPAGGTDTSDPVEMLSLNLNRLELRLERYQAERAATPGLDQARRLLDEARAGIEELRGEPLDGEDIPLRLHAVNSRFYEVEQLIPPLD